MSTSLRFEPYTMPAADLGSQNPLPDLSDMTRNGFTLNLDDTISDEEKETFKFGRVRNYLPYCTQDGYDRVKKPRAFDAAVLENDHLKAVFLPELGGRLWSLFDKDAGRELLYVNPVFQPANLAIRNAWISGGVEWNIGMQGHTPFTVSPLFTASYVMSDGTPVLRMYEWERIRRVSYQLEAFLPADSKFLFVRVQIVNTRPEDVPMYWWSNIAVCEAEDVRVIAPADRAFGHNYNKQISKVPVPIEDGIDKSYTTRVPNAMDWFFDIPTASRKWETAVDGGGYGLVQASTDRLIGRKMFLWGNNPGGKRWQEFLSVPDSAYLEIQAGLISTQMQHIKMPANAHWDWLEAYGALQTDPTIAHGEWTAAHTHITGQLNGMLPLEVLNDTLVHIRAASPANLTPARAGSGWGALEALRAAQAGEPFDTGGLLFPENMTDEEQAPWLSLLRTGVFPEQDPTAEPASYMSQSEWLALLKASIDNRKSDHWYAWLQLGVLYFANSDVAQAKAAFITSNERRPNAWAVRNLGVLKRLDGDVKAAAETLLEAARIYPQRHIVIECGKTLIDAGLYDTFITFEAELPQALRENGRVRTQKIDALIHLGQLDQARALFGEDLTVNDVREGEILLSDLWVLLHRKRIACDTNVDEANVTNAEALAQYPLPRQIDFRMHI